MAKINVSNSNEVEIPWHLYCLGGLLGTDDSFLDFEDFDDFDDDDLVDDELDEDDDEEFLVNCPDCGEREIDIRYNRACPVCDEPIE